MASSLSEMAARVADGVDSFNAVSDKPCLRLFYVGSDSYEEGRVEGEAIGRQLNGKGALSVFAERFPGISVAPRQSRPGNCGTLLIAPRSLS
jgi:ABC-type sugar transport system substrate-binding protein